MIVHPRRTLQCSLQSFLGRQCHILVLLAVRTEPRVFNAVCLVLVGIDPLGVFRGFQGFQIFRHP